MSQTSIEFMSWCIESVERARGYATKNGTNIVAAMYQMLPATLVDASVRFPDIEPSVAIHDLLSWAVQTERTDDDAEESRRVEQSWKDWCGELVEKARGDAVKHGMTVEEVMLRTRHLYVNEIRDRFPSMDLSKALDELGSLACAADSAGASDPAQGPMPRRTWEEWCQECVEEARGYATRNGTSIETAMLRILSMLINETMARFPELELRVAIKELAWWAARTDNKARGKSD
jgi:hypothetical protein